METYDVRCPICGELNHNLYLDEMDGVRALPSGSADTGIC